MSIVEWQSAYEIGIPKIDEQHRKLIGFMNKLARVTDDGSDQAVVEEVLLDLIGYVRYHFAEEEQLMAENRYAEIDRHADLHMEFTLKVASMFRQYSEGSGLSALTLLSFLKTYLIEHILREDIRLKVLANRQLVAD